MNFDRNTIIGFVILALLFMGFFYYTNQQQAAFQKEKALQDSIANAHKPKPNAVAAQKDTAALPVASNDTAFHQGAAERLDSMENGLIKIVFSSKGGQPRRVELKNFKAPDSNDVRLAATDFDRISYKLVTGANKTDDIVNFNFNAGQVVRNPDSSQTLTYQLPAANGAMVEHQFTLRPNNYMVDFNIHINGVPQLLTNNTLYLNWQNRAMQLQKDLTYERQQSQIGYRVSGDYDHSSALTSNSQEFTKPVNWVAVKQQFFNTTLIAKNNFTSGNIVWTAPVATDQKTVVEANASFTIRLTESPNANIPLAVYYGPTDYNTLKQYGNDMESMVNLGSGIFSFVKYINRWIVIPIFGLFSKLTPNFGIAILLLTLFIRLVISPLTYSSYLSGAKMKVLRPEIDQLKVKYNGDQQQISVEQMRLFREAGVNPLGGCIPALLQIPIFFALYSFFNSSVALRGQSFLWAKDLSQYDSIVDLPFKIPLYGDHVSLFTITAVITSFLISLYSMSMTPDQGNPVLKYMPYFFPIILLFIFNKLPSGLTWYYTVSNLITLGLQFVIQNYIIDHDKILAKMDANRKKPKAKSKWAQRLEEMQEQQKQLRDTQNKNRR